MQPQGQTQIIVNRVDTASTSRPPATAQDGTTKAHPKPWAKTQLDLTPKASSASKPESRSHPPRPHQLRLANGPIRRRLRTLRVRTSGAD